MKKQLQLSALLIAIGTLLFAQDKTEMQIKVTQNGKVVKDTTYLFDDAKEAKHAMHIMNAMASDKLDIFLEDSEGHDHLKKHASKMIVISEDGKHQEMAHNDHDVMVIHEKEIDDNVEVILKKLKDGDCEDGSKKVMKREIIIVSEGEDGETTWTIDENEEGEKIEVILIKKAGSGEEEIEVELKESKKSKKK